MATFRTVNTAFWETPQVVDNFSPADRYIYLYCLTNPHTNLCGCYEISIRQIAAETGLDRDFVQNSLDRLHLLHHVIEYQPQSKELLIYDWPKSNWTASPKKQRRILCEIAKVKCWGFRLFLRAEYHRRQHKKDTMRRNT